MPVVFDNAGSLTAESLRTRNDIKSSKAHAAIIAAYDGAKTAASASPPDDLTRKALNHPHAAPAAADISAIMKKTEVFFLMLLLSKRKAPHSSVYKTVFRNIFKDKTYSVYH